MTEFEAVLSMGAANTPVHVLTALLAAGYTGFAAATEYTVACDDQDAGTAAGTMATCRSTAASEADGRRITPGDSRTERAASAGDIIDLTQKYVISATANKKFVVKVRTR